MGKAGHRALHKWMGPGAQKQGAQQPLKMDTGCEHERQRRQEEPQVSVQKCSTPLVTRKLQINVPESHTHVESTPVTGTHGTLTREGLQGGSIPLPRPLDMLPSPVSTVKRPPHPGPHRMRTTRSHWAPRSWAHRDKVPGEPGSFCCVGEGGSVGGATWREPGQPRGASTGQ